MENKINPNWITAPYAIAFMTKDGCYHYEEGKGWFQFHGYDEQNNAIWESVNESQVPDSFKSHLIS